MGANFSHQQQIITTRSELEEEINLFRQDQLISSFINIAIDQTEEAARRLLQTTNWNIDEAINLYFIQKNSVSTNQVQNSRTSEDSDSDSSLFPLPSYRFQEDSFEAAKSVSIEYNLWLIVNLQSRRELSSNILNRDLWGNDAVSGIVQSKFILWQVYNDSTLGQKICSFYKIESAPPVVLVIDPITGLKMNMWSGVIEAEGFVEDLMKFTENGPREYIASQARNMSMEVLDNYLPRNNNNQNPESSWGEEFEEEDNSDSRNSNEDTWDSRNDDNEDTWTSSNNDEDTWHSSNEETWATRNNDEEDTWASRNDNEDSRNDNEDSRNDNEETWCSENNNEETWDSRNHNEETWDNWTSKNYNDQNPAPSWGEEFEDEGTWPSRNYNDQNPAPSWGEEFEEEGTWSSRNNNNQNPVAYWGQEALETLSSRSDSDDFVPPYIGEEYEESDDIKEDKACLEYPILTEEPKGDCDPSLMCSLCVRYPDGRRKQRKFLKNEPVQLLWSLCYSHMDESEEKAFKLVHAIPGASKTLDYGANVTFEESGLANSMISVIWE